MKKIGVDKDTVAKIRAKIRNTGPSRRRVQEIVDEVIGEVWKESCVKNLPGR